MEGKGVVRYANGDVFEGGWKYGVREGKGVVKYSNGKSYKGE